MVSIDVHQPRMWSYREVISIGDTVRDDRETRYLSGNNVKINRLQRSWKTVTSSG